MSIDQDFLDAVKPLYAKTMGTELVAEVIYSLVRMTRPTRVLEVGAGYTSLFILKALTENARDYEAERARLGEQVKNGEALETNALPDYYLSRNKKESWLHTIDTFSHGHTSAPRVAEVARKLKIDSHLKFHKTDFRGYSKNIDRACIPFDLVWFDCGGLAEYTDFLAEYWEMINPDGGLLILHSTLTNVAIQGLLEELKPRQAESDLNQFELVSLLEPHKFRQNSLTLIRMISGYKKRTYTDVP